MPELLAIDEVTIEDVRDVVREALRDGTEYDVIADFVARVDWSGTNRRVPAIAGVLSRLEAWSTEYAEGDLVAEEYIARLRELLAASEAGARQP